MVHVDKTCPVCLLAGAEVEEETIRCERCGTFSMLPEARDLLVDAEPDSGPWRSYASHRLRWIVRKDAMVIVDLHVAKGILLHRRFDHPRSASTELIFGWVASQDAPCRETLLGWAAVAGNRDPADASRRLSRLSQHGLVVSIPSNDGRLEVTLGENGRQLWDRRKARRTNSPREHVKGSDRRSPARAKIYAVGLSLRDFKCFGDEQYVSFCHEDGRLARWTFLVGENGVGKTSVLQTLAALMPTPGTNGLVPLYETDTSSVGDAILSFRSDRRGILELTTGEGDLEAIPSIPFLTGVQAHGARTIDSLLHTLQAVAQDIRVSWTGGKRIGTTYSAVPDRASGSTLTMGMGAGRIVGESKLSAVEGDEDAILTLFRPDVPLRNPEEWLLQADYASRFEDNNSDYRTKEFDRVVGALLEILPEVRTIAVQPPVSKSARPWVGFAIGNATVPLTNLSIGYQSVVAWVIELALAMARFYPDSQEPLTEPAIVLIDEIDNHLHPKWQRELPKYLEKIFPKAQFIATTHSPLVIQGAVDANLVLLRKVGDFVEVVNDVDEIRNFRVDQMLTSDLFGLRSAQPDYIVRLIDERTRLMKSEEAESQLSDLQRINAKLEENGFPASVLLKEDTKAFLATLAAREL